VNDRNRHEEWKSVNEKGKLKIKLCNLKIWSAMLSVKTHFYKPLLLKGKERHLDKERKTNTNILIFIGVI
jgi:hypothetical protein